MESGRVVHVIWERYVGHYMSQAKFLSDRYFSVHLTTNIGDVKLLTNVKVIKRRGKA